MVDTAIIMGAQAARRARAAGPDALAAATGAAWQLVPRYGLRGATWSLLVGIAFETVCYFVAVAIPLRAALRGKQVS